MKNRFLTKSMITAVLLGGALSFTSCNDEFNEKDFLNQQYDLADKATAKQYAHELAKLAQEHANAIDLKRVTEAIKDESRKKYLEEYRKAALVKKINFITLDKITGKPVAGVKVTFLGKTGTSDEQGVAILEDVPVGAGDTFIEAPEDYFSATAPAYNPYTTPRSISVNSTGGAAQDAYWVKEVTQTINLLPKSSMTKEYTTLKGTVKMDLDMSNDTLESAPDGIELTVDYSAVAGIGKNDNANPTHATEFTFYAYFIKGEADLPSKTVTKDGAYSIKVPSLEDIKLVVAKELVQDITYIKGYKKLTGKGYFNIPTAVAGAYKTTGAQTISSEKLFAFEFSKPKADGFDLDFNNTFKPYGQYTDASTTSTAMGAAPVNAFGATDAVSANNAQLGINGARVNPASATQYDVVLLGNGYQSHPTITGTGLTGGDEVFLRGQFEVKTGATGSAFKASLSLTAYQTARSAAHADAQAAAPASPGTGRNYSVYGTVIDGDGVKTEDVKLGQVRLKVNGTNVEMLPDAASVLDPGFISNYNDITTPDKRKSHHSVEITHISGNTGAATANQKIPASAFNLALNYKDFDANAAATSTDKSKDPYKLLAFFVKEDTGTASSYSAYPTFAITGGTPDGAAQFSLGSNRSSVHKAVIANAGTGYVHLPAMNYKADGYGATTDMFGQPNGSDKFSIDTTGKIVALTSNIEVTVTPAEADSFKATSSNLRAYAVVGIDSNTNTVAQKGSFSKNYTGTAMASRARTGLRSNNNAAFPNNAAYASSATGVYKTKPTHTYKPKYTWAAANEVTPAEFSYGHSTSNYKVHSFAVTKKGEYIDVRPMAGVAAASTSHETGLMDLRGLKGKEKVQNFVLPIAQFKK